MSKAILLIGVLAVITAVLLLAFLVNGSIIFKKEGFEEKRAKNLNELSLSIEEAKEQGKYNCCITPPCTMCYLGNWIWEDGICRCDEMIAKGEFDKVCPQCRAVVGEGSCK